MATENGCWTLAEETKRTLAPFHNSSSIGFTVSFLA